MPYYVLTTPPHMPLFLFFYILYHHITTLSRGVWVDRYLVLRLTPNPTVFHKYLSTAINCKERGNQDGHIRSVQGESIRRSYSLTLPCDGNDDDGDDDYTNLYPSTSCCFLFIYSSPSPSISFLLAFTMLTIPLPTQMRQAVSL